MIPLSRKLSMILQRLLTLSVFIMLFHPLPVEASKRILAIRETKRQLLNQGGGIVEAKKVAEDAQKEAERARTIQALKEELRQAKEEKENKIAEASVRIKDLESRLQAAEKTTKTPQDIRQERLEQLEQQLREAEQQRDDALEQLHKLKGGQAMPTKENFLSLNVSPIHCNQLKEVDQTLEEQQSSKLHSIVIGLEGLLQFPVKVKSIQKVLATQQLNRLKALCENADFEVDIFLKALAEVNAQLTFLDFGPIIEAAKWFEIHRDVLMKTEKHRTYVMRQQKATELTAQKQEGFNQFYTAYLTEIVPKICQSFIPLPADGETTKQVKLDLIQHLKWSGLVELKRYLDEQIKPFGKRDDFLHRTLSPPNNKDYEEFKRILGAYDYLFHDLGEYKKLVEDCLTFAFFKQRYTEARSELEQIDLSTVENSNLRALLQKIKEEDVLAYDWSKETLFLGNVTDLVPVARSKKEDHPIDPLVEKLLSSYQQISCVGTRIRTDNPRVPEFHAE
jgi:hypothetical protein